MKVLREVFQDRTIGWRDGLGWQWRGPGYDEGWAEPTQDDLAAVRDAIDHYLENS